METGDGRPRHRQPGGNSPADCDSLAHRNSLGNRNDLANKVADENNGSEVPTVSGQPEDVLDPPEQLGEPALSLLLNDRGVADIR